jgi:hypothetical protein
MGIKRELRYREFKNRIFLTGCMRSGTTFLANLWSEHPQLFHLEGELLDTWTDLGGIDCIGDRKYADRLDLKSEFIVNMESYFEQALLEFEKPKYTFWRWVNRMTDLGA